MTSITVPWTFSTRNLPDDDGRVYGFGITTPHETVLDITRATYAISLLHRAAENLGIDILHRCVLSSLATIDILRAMGVRSALKSFRCGHDVFSAERRQRSITGCITAHNKPDRINAHIVVRWGSDFILDPTLGQLRKPWNDVATAGVVPVLAPTVESVLDANYFHARRYAFALTDEGCEISYFELPKLVEHSTRLWRHEPDARPERRAPLVKEAVRLMRLAPKMGQEVV
ncbi:hypothetical protein [Microvirga splendida]|uniref:Uncharacterized protein n=1 Tax=Microvirga splendida TaxID=2795727 RepID=A0ABS0XZC4_9HYPH|nr:hypothetical protein [Microvirga splendida]MBJ6125406.1 hypothetical protein [Microvirga splendida]